MNGITSKKAEYMLCLDSINTLNGSNSSSDSSSSAELDSNFLFLYYCMFTVLFYALLIVRLSCTLLQTNQCCLQRFTIITSQKSDQLLVHRYIPHKIAYSVATSISTQNQTVSSTCAKHQNARSAKTIKIIMEVSFNYKMIAKIIVA